MIFVDTFLMTYQSFTTPQKLLAKLVQRWHVPLHFKANAEDRNATVKAIRLRVVNVLRKWLELYFTDFNEELLETVRQFVQQMKHSGEASLSNIVEKALARHETANSAVLRKIYSDPTPEPHVGPAPIWPP